MTGPNKYEPRINSGVGHDKRVRVRSIQAQLLRLRRAWSGQVPSAGLIHVVVHAELDARLGRKDRLRFLSWVFGRKISTSSVGIIGGLEGGEEFALVAWGQPQKLDDDWVCGNPRWREDVAAICQCFRGPR